MGNINMHQHQHKATASQIFNVSESTLDHCSRTSTLCNRTTVVPVQAMCIPQNLAYSDLERTAVEVNGFLLALEHTFTTL